MSKARITLFGRPGCHLCDEAEARLKELAPGEPIELINIELDDALHRQMLERIPVIHVDGEQLAELVQYRRPSFAERLRACLAR